ncbi:MAG: hypothetical protein ACOH5I_06900 [Oligoflexus sp.]
MDWFRRKGVLEQIETLVVCSSGGASLHYQLQRWYHQNPQLPLPINKILWENGPGECSVEEVYRGVIQMFGDRRDRFYKRLAIMPLLRFANLWCVKQGEKVRRHNWQPHFLQEKITRQYCLASRIETVVFYDHLSNWAKMMQELGQKMHLITYDDLGHLKAHRNPVRYQEVCSNLLYG